MRKNFFIALILIIIASIITTFAIIIYNLKHIQNISSANETIKNIICKNIDSTNALSENQSQNNRRKIPGEYYAFRRTL